MFATHPVALTQFCSFGQQHVGAIQFVFSTQSETGVQAVSYGQQQRGLGSTVTFASLQLSLTSLMTIFSATQAQSMRSIEMKEIDLQLKSARGMMMRLRMFSLTGTR